MENYEEVAVIDEQPNHYNAALSSLENDRLTIENNEETEHNDDNLNESSSVVVEEAADAAVATEVELNNDDAAIEVAGEVVNNGSDVEITEDDAEDDEDTAFGGAQDKLNEAVAEAEEQVAAEIINKEREDIASSDDEDAAIEMNPTFNAEWADLAADLAATNDANNDFTNDIDVYDTVPVDLSNDIAVNEWAAAQANYPLNSDAEFIDVMGPSNNGPFAMPQFEKLTIGANMPATSYQAMTTTHNMK